MGDTTDTAAPTPATRWSRGRAWRLAGALLGVLLLGAAVRAVWVNADAFDRVRAGLADAPTPSLVLLALLPCLSWLLTTGVFVTLFAPRARVRATDMAALVGASWLLNYLPLSPGLVARVAYQKQAMGIPVRTSARVVLESILAGLAGGAVLLAEIAGGASVLGAPLPPGVGGVLLCLGALGLLGACARGWVPTLAAAGSLAVLLKYVDTLAWSLRYWTIFGLLGVPVSASQAVAIALVAQVSMLVPGLGNGLGLREWTVGLLASSLPAWWGAGGTGGGAIVAGPALALALAADLTLRAFEVGCAVLAGLWGGVRLARRRTGFVSRS